MDHYDTREFNLIRIDDLERPVYRTMSKEWKHGAGFCLMAAELPRRS
jgi:hypothetical protein